MRADRWDVVVISHGFQSHYELGFSNGLAEQGMNVLLLSSDNTLVDRLHPRITALNIRGSQDPNRPKWRKIATMLNYQLRLCKVLLRCRGLPIIFIGIFKPGYGMFESRVVRALSTHFSLVVHNILPHDRHSDDMRRLHRKLYARPDLLLVHVPATGNELVSDFGVDPSRIVLAEHGLNDAVALSTNEPTVGKVALGLPATRRTVLFFGFVSEFKGLHHLLDAIESREDVTLLIAGRCGDDPYGARMRTRLTKLTQEGKSVWFDGFVSEETIGRVFAAADVVALPYAHIDQSGVVVLALSLGVPVIVTRCGGFLDLVNDANGLFIDEASGACVSGALDRFYAQPVRSKEQVKTTVAHLKWEQTLRKLGSRLRQRAAA